ALRALIASNNEKALLFAIKSLIDPSENVRVAIRSELKNIGARAVGALSQALHNDNLRLCREAAEVLAKIEDPSAVQALMQFLSLDLEDSAALAKQKLVANTLILMGTSDARSTVERWQQKNALPGGTPVQKLPTSDEENEPVQDILT